VAGSLGPPRGLEGMRSCEKGVGAFGVKEVGGGCQIMFGGTEQGGGGKGARAATRGWWGVRKPNQPMDFVLPACRQKVVDWGGEDKVAGTEPKGRRGE